MKTTRKHFAMLLLVTVGWVGLSGRAVADTDNYAESFESYSVGTAVTNFDSDLDSEWTSTETNTMIVATNYASQYRSGTNYPIDYVHDTATNNALKIENGVTNNILAGSSSLTNWLDVVINPVYSDDVPDVPPAGTVAAVYFNTNGNPVVMHTPTNEAYAEWVTITNRTVSEDDWIRLTIKADFGTVPGDPPIANPTRLYEVYINSIPLSNALAHATADRTSVKNGTWFGNRRTNVETSPFTNVTVKGTGYLDDMVITTSKIEFGDPPPPATTWTIDASAGTGGSITPSGSVTVTNGNNQSFTVAADSHYSIGDVVVVEGGTTNTYPGTNSYTFVSVTTNGSIDAAFVMNSTSNGTPTTWYDQFGLTPTTNTYDDLDSVDSDSDGVLNWKEYIAGTVPTNAASRFRIVGVAPDGSQLQWIGGTNGPPASVHYIVESTTSLVGTVIGWTNMNHNVDRQEGTNTWNGTADPNRSFFRVRATDQ